MKQLISLLILFFVVFAKYGEPRSKFMSIHGDINLAMLETSLTSIDRIGFIYDDQFGGFAVDPLDCYRRAGSSFFVGSDCSVSPTRAFTETPSDQHYRVSYNNDFPSRGLGANLIFGHRGSPGVVTKSVSKNGEAFVFTDIQDRISRRHSKIYCNDKNDTHYKKLLKPGNNDHAVILFRKRNRNKYEQTMKCIAILRTSRDSVRAARLFTVIISDLAHQPFTFYASRLSENQGVYSSEPTFSSVSHYFGQLIETTFVFRANASSGCPPRITLQPSSDKKRGFAFFYGNQVQRVPPIEADDSINCGISVALSAPAYQPTFHYYCECTA